SKQASARCAAWCCALRSLGPVCIFVPVTCAMRRGSLRGAQLVLFFLPVLLVAALRAGLVCAARMPLYVG
ncbi:hypothetical protein A2U01_0101051, partial [Trifolium medium]|nr:hypothetical protein [Trifolium medium]